MRWALCALLFPCLVLAQSNPTCGNGTQDVGERCDDGNTIDGDGCSSACVPEFCGDKIVNKKGEECDDGNVFPDDGCNECKKAAVVAESSEEEPATRILITPEEAFRRSLVTTLFLTPGLGLIYGPSMGHFAAGETGRGFGMSFLRAALVVSPLLITRLTINADPELNVNPKTGPILLSINALVLTTLVAIDLLDGPHAIERAKKKQ